jgi:deoxyribodipyrimidine photo-lyase
VSPYFRIFNPVTQSKKFDAGGSYLRGYIPELSDVDDRTVHEPWKNPAAAPGYPEPLVGLQESRERALDAYQRLKEG